MQPAFNGSEKIGEIVAKFPKASHIFREYQIDFCCGGNRPLSEAIRAQNLDEAKVLGKLNQLCGETERLTDGETDWRAVSSSDLMDHIIAVHHAYLQKELPLLSDFVTKILRVHGAAHGEVLSGLHRLFHSLKAELEQHLIKEEEEIFPLIKQWEANPSQELLEKTVRAIGELEREHSAAGDLLKEMRQVTDHYKLPEEACRTYTLTFQKLEELEADLFQHIHLENNILFLRLTRDKI